MDEQCESPPEMPLDDGASMSLASGPPAEQTFTETPAEQSAPPAGSGPPPAGAGRPQPHVMWAFLLCLLLMAAQVAITIGFLAVFVVAIVCYAMFTGAEGRPGEIVMKQQPALMIALLPVGTGANLLVAVVVAWVAVRRRILDRLAIRNCSLWQWGLTVLLVFPVAVVASEVANLAAALLELAGQWLDLRLLELLSNEELFEQLSGLPWPFIFVSACLLPGVGEEIFFRGYLSRGMVARHGLVPGALLTSLLFGMVHVAPVQACATAVIGLAIQVLFLTTRSLPAAMLAHTLNNLLAFTMTRYQDAFPIPGVSTVDPSGFTHVHPLLLAASLLCIGTVIALLVQTRTRWLLPGGEEWSPGYFATERPDPAWGAHAACAPPKLLLAAGLLISLVALAGTVAWIVSGNL